MTRDELLALHRDFDGVVDRIEDLTLEGKFPMDAGAQLMSLFNAAFVPWFRAQRELLGQGDPENPATWPE